jgi:transposase
MERHALSDAQWARLRRLLPPPSQGRGRPRTDDRRIVDGIVWRLATGVPWRDLPERFGSWRTVYSRFRRWQQAGVWDRVLAALQAEADAHGDLDWRLHFLDGTTIRAHQHAAGAKKGAAIRPSAAPGAASPPNSISGPKGAASR